MFGRCLSNGDRVMRGISAALPLLGKLRFGKFCFGGCFVDGTPVQMADGTTKPVEQIKEGDLVLSKDEQTGIISAKRVTGTSTRMVPVVETVNLADDAGKVVESLTVTGDHPFYVEGEGFLAASQLPAGIKVETQSGVLTVSSTERHETAQGVVVHNFTVEDDHSYFVGSASGGAWVHNGNCWGRRGSPLTRAQIDNLADQLVDQGWRISHGAYGMAEEYTKGGSGVLGSAYSDIRAVNNVTGRVLRINTVDTYKNGLPTLRELLNAARIIAAHPNDYFTMIPKP